MDFRSTKVRALVQNRLNAARERPSDAISVLDSPDKEPDKERDGVEMDRLDEFGATSRWFSL